MTTLYERQGYTVVEPGNADIARRLRAAFGIAERFGVDMATTIVPVVMVELDEADDLGSGAGGQCGLNRQAIAGEVSVVGLLNSEQFPVTVRNVRFLLGAGRGQMRVGEAPISFVGSTGGGGENFSSVPRDTRRAYPNVHGISGHALPANMPAFWDNNFTRFEIEGGAGANLIRHLTGPWTLNPGERIVLFPMSGNVSAWAFFEFE